MATWQKRLTRDLRELEDSGFKVVPESGNEIQLDCFRVILKGPSDTPYAAGTWHVRFTIAPTFPFTSPSVGFVERILHPNVDWQSGSVCLDALNKKWSPVFTLKHIMDSLLPYLLSYPNPDDPLNREAAAHLRADPQGYAVQVVETTLRHAPSSRFEKA